MATDEQIATAFNAGYTIQKTDPGMVQKLLATDNKNSEIVQAVKQGSQKYQRERIASQQQSIKEKQQNRGPKR